MTSIAPLPKSVIEADHRLQAIASKGATELLNHRWHWTSDENNAKRVSTRQYAKEVKIDDGIVRRDVRAYELMIAEGGVGHAPTPEEARERASTTVEKYQAVEAIATARGVGAHTARQRHQDEVKRVRDWARDRAEEHGTTIEDEMPKVAKAIVKKPEAEKRDRDNARKERT